ncbi:uncharacterized protein PV09_09288 [Verruconis gallopava]|uniref:Enoyl-CoA hydratase n=1 Tax=Verruconis gallopava TaxID=253628 RepID=A0A0D2AJ58_9PEZI|nr:uncharacterized protein PV09_09288 [Verruconis gallopava]KIV98953.1 hypothetical protein PV09_09288 [Verruconis gallopava]
MSADEVTLRTKGNVAIITINKPRKLNAMTSADYFKIACLLHEVASMDDITITILIGKGRFFSAGADVSVPRKVPAENSKEDARAGILYTGVANNLHITQAFYSHPKILVAALNGPCVGLSAAIAAHADFVYAAPHTFLLTPFSSLGLVSEGLAAQTFVQRMGLSKANEALIQSKRITCEELVHTGFVNKVLDGAGDPKAPGYSEKFLAEVLKEVDDRMGDHLSHSSMLEIKKQIKAPFMQTYNAQGSKEVFGLLDRFLSGVPQKEFAKVASGQKKHKL